MIMFLILEEAVYWNKYLSIGVSESLHLLYVKNRQKPQL